MMKRKKKQQQQQSGPRTVKIVACFKVIVQYGRLWYLLVLHEPPHTLMKLSGMKIVCIGIFI